MVRSIVYRNDSYCAASPLIPSYCHGNVRCGDTSGIGKTDAFPKFHSRCKRLGFKKREFSNDHRNQRLWRLLAVKVLDERWIVIVENAAGRVDGVWNDV